MSRPLEVCVYVSKRCVCMSRPLEVCVYVSKRCVSMSRPLEVCVYVWTFLYKASEALRGVWGSTMCRLLYKGGTCRERYEARLEAGHPRSAREV
jgi:hypothetical protein